MLLMFIFTFHLFCRGLPTEQKLNEHQTFLFNFEVQCIYATSGINIEILKIPNITFLYVYYDMLLQI